MGASGLDLDRSVALESGEEPALATVNTDSALALTALSGSQTSDQLGSALNEGSMSKSAGVSLNLLAGGRGPRGGAGGVEAAGTQCVRVSTSNVPHHEWFSLSPCQWVPVNLESPGLGGKPLASPHSTLAVLFLSGRISGFAVTCCHLVELLGWPVHGCVGTCTRHVVFPCRQDSSPKIHYSQEARSLGPGSGPSRQLEGQGSCHRPLSHPVSAPCAASGTSSS